MHYHFWMYLRDFPWQCIAVVEPGRWVWSAGLAYGGVLLLPSSIRGPGDSADSDVLSHLGLTKGYIGRNFVCWNLWCI